MIPDVFSAVPTWACRDLQARASCLGISTDSQKAFKSLPLFAMLEGMREAFVRRWHAFSGQRAADWFPLPFLTGELARSCQPLMLSSPYWPLDSESKVSGCLRRAVMFED